MKNNTAIMLGTPAVGAIVFGLSGSIITLNNNVATGSLAIIGWAAGHIALNSLINPGQKLFRNVNLDTNKNPVENTTFLMQNGDGFTARVSTDIPFSRWQAVGKVVVAWQAKNLNGTVIEKAFPNMVQSEQRALRTQMVGLLSPEHVGILAVKNNHAEITHPEGWAFFKRVSRGMVSPLHKHKIPFSPSRRESPQESDFNRHTRATRAILDNTWETSQQWT